MISFNTLFLLGAVYKKGPKSARVHAFVTQFQGDWKWHMVPWLPFSIRICSYGIASSCTCRHS